MHKCIQNFAVYFKDGGTKETEMNGKGYWIGGR